MKVKLQRTLFLDGNRYRAGVHDLPEDTVLPRDAVRLDEPAAKPAPSPVGEKDEGGPPADLGKASSTETGEGEPSTSEPQADTEESTKAPKAQEPKASSGGAKLKL